MSLHEQLNLVPHVPHLYGSLIDRSSQNTLLGRLKVDLECFYLSWTALSLIENEIHVMYSIVVV